MDVPRMSAFDVFKGKRVFLTGHTGFKGSWLALWLRQLGAEVYGYSLFPPPTDPSNYALARVSQAMAGETAGDIRDRDLLRTRIADAKPHAVFHLAAQPLVRESYLSPYETFDVNVMGTASLLDAVRTSGAPCAVICVTTDKCYENREQAKGYRESDPMGGHDPYSASKGAAEILISSYRRSFFNPDALAQHGVQVASARAGNVIGGGDWARDRIVADMVRSLLAGQPVAVRNPHAIRPWQHVLEPLSGYLTLAAAMLSRPSPAWCEGWNFGPSEGTEATVGVLADTFIRAWGSGTWTDASDPHQPHEASILRLNVEKAGSSLCWTPRWTLEETARRTALWYRRALRERADAQALCLNDIRAYEGYGEDGP